jgi:hypothetical protein
MTNGVAATASVARRKRSRFSVFTMSVALQFPKLREQRRCHATATVSMWPAMIQHTDGERLDGRTPMEHAHVCPVGRDSGNEDCKCDHRFVGFVRFVGSWGSWGSACREISA